jgi:glycosyltransferase involved in cell wall biosynthesis
MSRASFGWVIPDILGAGSGGGNAILDHVKDLSELYDQTIYTKSTIRHTIESLYGKLPDNVDVKNVITKQHDIMFATWWETVNTVLNSKAKHKAYFIQDIEYLFYPVSDSYFGAMETYQKGLIHIARGEYIKQKLNTKYCINFCADPIYRPLEGFKKTKAICYTYQPQKPHRCHQMALDALRIFKKNNPEYTVYLYGSDLNRSSQPEMYPEFINLGLLTFSDSNKLYNICELGVCFSPTNPSNIPYEMMAAGLPCLDLDTKNKQDFPDNLLYLTVPNTFVIASKIEEILKDTDRLELASRAGLHFMKNRPLGLAFNQMREAVADILEGGK